MVRRTAEKMDRTGFFSVFSIILGLPGETGEDVAATHRLVRDLIKGRAVVFPVFYEPAGGRAADAPAFRLATMREDHLALFVECYENNFKQVPRLYWDNQRAGGVSWLRRAIIQMLGRTEVISWRRKFSRLRRQIAARGAEGEGKIVPADGPVRVGGG
jgi:hypothetical protein